MSAFLLTLFTSVSVFTLVMTIGGLFKLTDLIAHGVHWRPLASIFVMSVPQVLSYSIPVSALVSSLLVFGRLSADGETVAMRSCGVSLFRVAMPIWLCGLLLSGVCMVIHNWVVPITHYKTRVTIAGLKNDALLDLLEEGRFVETLPGLSVYVGQRTESGFEDIRVQDMRSDFRREITARTGLVLQDRVEGEVSLELHDVRIDPFQEGKTGAAYCSVWTLPLNTSKRRATYTAKTTNLTGPKLWHSIRYPEQTSPELTPEELAVERSTWRVEFHSRLALSLSCFTFLALGVPLGIRSHRKETTSGIAIGLGLLVAFHIFLIAADTLAKQPALYPHLIVWIPVASGALLGFWLLRRAE